MLLSKNTALSFSDWLQYAPEEGCEALVDKPAGWTSFDVVAKLRNLTGIKKVGHTGTLDPFATGLLILCFGRSTKKISSYNEYKKVYTGIIRLGAVTKTLDTESEEEKITDISQIDIKQIIEAAPSFIGKLQQIPPVFSAKKIGGRRLYELARKNIDVQPLPKEVEVYRFDILDYSMPFVRFEAECSTGTYIRSLARDLGAMLSCGGYLSELRRTSIGEYKVEAALKIEDFIEMKNSSLSVPL
ncbi:MAG: tRNA pseudouridine(55) synthase [Ignavibacteria bacterium]|nr:tRNA pseudouridine(55) synthase [Ignavibacteria bacterium]